MAIIDVVMWKGTPEVLAYKFPETNLTTLTQLIVYESQEAILVHKGKVIETFTAGKYTLSTENIPVLETLYGIPFGGNNPFTAEVWFINKAIKLDVKWGTQTPIQLRDPVFGVMVPLKGYGQFGVQIENSTEFLLKLVGVLPSFDVEVLSNYFRGVLMSRISSIIAEKIIKEKLSVLELAAYLFDISEDIKSKITPEFSRFGIDIINFYINSLNVPEEDPAIEHLKALLSKRAEMNVLGYSYQEERSYDVLNSAASNSGVAGGVMGAGVGMGMGFGIGGNVGNMMGQMVTDKIDPAKADSKAEVSVQCNKCKNPIPKSAKYCPSCGDIYNACVKCGFDNELGVQRCAQCGELQPVACIKCGEMIDPNVKFCHVCGVAQAKECSQCGISVGVKAKFCPECGTSIS